MRSAGHTSPPMIRGVQGGYISLDCGEQSRHAAEHCDLVLDEELGKPVTQALGIGRTGNERCPGDPCLGQISSKEKSKAIDIPG